MTVAGPETPNEQDPILTLYETTNQNTSEAVQEVREFLKIGRDMAHSDEETSSPLTKDTDFCRTMRESYDPVMELEDFLFDSSRSLVQCVTADFRIITLCPGGPTYDPSLVEMVQNLKRQPVPGETFAVKDTDLPRWRFYMITKTYAWEQTDHSILFSCLNQLKKLMEDNKIGRASW